MKSTKLYIYNKLLKEKNHRKHINKTCQIPRYFIKKNKSNLKNKKKTEKTLFERKNHWVLHAFSSLSKAPSASPMPTPPGAWSPRSCCSWHNGWRSCREAQKAGLSVVFKTKNVVFLRFLLDLKLIIWGIVFLFVFSFGSLGN